MLIKANAIRLSYTEQGKAEIILSTDTNRIDIRELKDITANGKALMAEIKQYRVKRSLDANAYMWVLADKIAVAIKSTKEEVYRKAIKDVGKFTVVPIIDNDVDNWIKDWERDGLGWFCEIMGESKLEGYTNIISYHGSSSYNTKRMSRLIDWIVEEAKELGIETMTDNQLRQMKNEWGR